jgi:hypothetical protein
MAESKRFLLRVNPDLFDALRRWADDELRSINAQIEYVLTEQARRAGRLTARRARPSSDGDASDDPSADGPEAGERPARGARSGTAVRP